MEFQFKSFGDYGCHKEGVQLFGGMVQNLWEVPKMEDDGKVRAGYELVRNGIPAESECLNLAYQPAIVKVFIENFKFQHEGSNLGINKYYQHSLPDSRSWPFGICKSGTGSIFQSGNRRQIPCSKPINGLYF